MSPEEPQPLTSDTARILEIGMALWGVALVVTLLVPALHQAGRQWWPWVCVTGIVGGGLALLHVRRGHGNAQDAHLPTRPPPPTGGPTQGAPGESRPG